MIACARMMSASMSLRLGLGLGLAATTSLMRGFAPGLGTAANITKRIGGGGSVYSLFF